MAVYINLDSGIYTNLSFDYNKNKVIESHNLSIELSMRGSDKIEQLNSNSSTSQHIKFNNVELTDVSTILEEIKAKLERETSWEVIVRETEHKVGFVSLPEKRMPVR